MLLSVIIPCYNVSKTILRTIASLECQTCKDFEIILVNDGSKDDTLRIIEDFASSREGVKVIDKANGGVSSARNVGIRAAKGKYLYFLDGDDTAEPNLVDTIKQHQDKDMIIFGFEHQQEKKNVPRIPYIQSDYVKAYLLGKIHIGVFSFIISKKIVETNSLSFDEHTFFSEDIEFVAKCVVCSKSFGVISEVLSHYMFNQESVTHTPSAYSERNITSVRAFKRIYKFVSENSPKHKNVALLRYQMATLSHLSYYYKKNTDNSALLQELNDNAKILKQNSGIYFCKYALYTQVMRLAYLIDLRLFKKLIYLR
jgi:glycosyltransferase involved in cell wall biosynthesis